MQKKQQFQRDEKSIKDFSPDMERRAFNAVHLFAQKAIANGHKATVQDIENVMGKEVVQYYAAMGLANALKNVVRRERS